MGPIHTHPSLPSFSFAPPSSQPYLPAPYVRARCHSTRAYALDFLRPTSSSVFVTAGQDNTHRNVAVWDALMPPGSVNLFPESPAEPGACGCVRTWHCHRGGASVLTVVPERHLIISGGKRGDLVFVDLRRPSAPALEVPRAHGSAVAVLCVSPPVGGASLAPWMISTGTDGETRFWDLATLTEVPLAPISLASIAGAPFPAGGGGPGGVADSLPLHERKLFKRGACVTDAVATPLHLLSCGIDGRVLVRQLVEQ